MDLNTEAKTSTKTMSLVIFLMLVAVVLMGLSTADTVINKTTLNKNAFVCTKIEQVGKNMDNVVCVQYTHQKHYQNAVTLNSFATK